jgi:hypothetical protein
VSTVYACPWWCRSVDHPRRGVFELDQLGIGAPVHRVVFGAVESEYGRALVEISHVDNDSAPPVVSVVGDCELPTAAQARQVAAWLIEAADLLDQCRAPL